MDQKKKYRAFISYSHADRQWGRWLHRLLERYRTPRHLITGSPASNVPPRLTPIFLDREELASSPDLSERINSALENSASLIVICSPAAARSRWVDQEIETFKRLGGSDQIFCLIVDGDPGIPGADTDCFPPALRIRFDNQGRRLDGPTEPVAADVREHADGKRLAVQKMIAGLLNVGLDDLRQRETQRRFQRLLMITAGSIFASLITVTLAIRATLASNEAQQRKQQAEELLSFMVGDLRSSLQPIGRLDLLEGIGEQAQDYFATVEVDTLTDGELLRQAEVLNHLGQIHFERLQYSQALAAFIDAHERSAALVDADPTKGDRLFNRGQAEFWIGYVHWRSGSVGEAESWLSRYRDTSLELTSVDPANRDWIREVGYAYHNLAVLAEDHGDLQAAERGYRYLLSILEELEGSESNTQLQRDIADAVSWLGNVSLNRSNLAEAKSHYVRSVEKLKLATELEPGNAITLDELAFAIYRVAQIASITAELEEALVLVDESISLFDQLVNQDETNLDFLRRSTIPRLLKARILAARGEFLEAEGLAEFTGSTLEDLVSGGGTEHQLFSYLADTYSLKALLEEKRGAYRHALQLNQLAMDQFAALEDADRLNDERLFSLANAYVTHGALLARLGDSGKARTAWLSVEKRLKSRITESSTYYLLDPWARLLLLTGRTAEGQKVSDALGAHRYVPLEPWPLD